MDNMNLDIRQALSSDLKEIVEVYTNAREFMHSLGNDQWDKNYPNERIIQSDIDNKESFVCSIKEKIMGVFVFTFKTEPYYENLTEGSWSKESPYSVLHRLGMSIQYRSQGLSLQIFKYIEEKSRGNGCYSVRVDTHEKNIPMIKVLMKNNFLMCGKFIKNDGNERIVFEKVLTKPIVPGFEILRPMPKEY